MVVELWLWNKMIMAAFGSRKVLREKKKNQGKCFSHIWFHYEKYKRK